MPPVRRTDGPVRGTGNGVPCNKNRGPFKLSKMPFIATVPLTTLIVGARAELLRNGQNKGPQLAQSMLRADFREGDEDSNFSIFRVWRFSEGPKPLH